MKKIAGLTAALVLMPNAAMADNKPNQSADMGDADRIICKEVKKPGSRIAMSRSCHTAAEWALLRREQRQTVEKIQHLKGPR